MFKPERRALLIMHNLVNANKPVSAEVLASVLGTSSRTIRTDIALLDRVLNRINARIISRKGSGYEIEASDPVEMRIFVDSLNDVVGATPQAWVSDRIDVLVHAFLFTAEPLKSDDLAEAFHISRTTLSGNLKPVRATLDQFHLGLIHRPNSGMSVSGSETHRRWAMVRYLFNDEDMALPSIPSLPLNLDLKQANDLLIQIVVERDVRIGSEALRDLATLACISAARVASGHPVGLSEEERFASQGLDELAMADRFWQSVGLVVPEEEVAFLALAMASRRTYGLADQFSLTEHKDLFFLADDLLGDLFRLTDVNLLLNKDARLLLVRELRGLRLRAALGYELWRSRATDAERPQAIVEYAVLIANRLQDVHQIRLNEVELANLALVLNIAMRGNEPAIPRKRVGVVFSQGLPVALDVAWKVQRLFPGLTRSIEPRELHELTEKDLRRFDLVLTDIPRVRFPPSSTIVRTTSRIDASARLAIEESLFARREAASAFLQRISPAAFLPKLQAETPEEALRAVCVRLTASGAAGEALIDHVLRRERRISTELGTNSAVAHSLVAVGDETTVGVALLRKPLAWRHGTVQVLFVVANGRAERFSFSVVSQLKELLQVPELVDALIRRSFDDYADFRELLFSYLVK